MELNIFKRSKQQQHSCFNNFVNKRNKKCNNKNNNYFYIRNSHRHHHRSYIVLLMSMLFLFDHAATAATLRHRMPVKPLVAATSNPTPSKPSADGVTPDEDVAGTKSQKPVIFGGGSDPLDTTDHSLDVTNEGDPDTMPVTDPDEVKPSGEWMNDQKKLVKRFNSHEKIPRRSQGSHDIFLPASGEDPRGYMRLDPEYQEAAPDVSDPKNEGNQWNEEAGGVENAIGEGAHANGALDAMIEPATPRQDVNSYDGGGEGDNVKAMVQSAAEESEEDESAGPFEDWKPAEKSKWEYNKEKDTPEMHDMKTHYQEEEQWENEKIQMTREIGEHRREQYAQQNNQKQAHEQSLQNNRPVLKADQETNAEKLQGNQQELKDLNNDKDIDGDVANQKSIEKGKKSGKIRQSALESAQSGNRLPQSSEREPDVTQILSAEEEMAQSIGTSPTKVQSKRKSTSNKVIGDKAPKPGQIEWIRTDPHTGKTTKGGPGYLFQKCRKGAPGMCWLPYKCKNHGGTTVSGKCYGGGDTVCCQNYQDYPLDPLPLMVQPGQMPKQLFEGQKVTLKGKKINIGERERALFDAIMHVGIKGEEACQFLAQMGHESDKFKAMEEYASGRAYNGRLDLGNTRQGDGVRYKGRGYIQLTGRANYRYYGQALGVDLENQPKRASDLDVAAAVAINYWFARVKYDKGVNGNFANTKRVTYKINGGSNGLRDRMKKFKAYKATMRL